MQPHKEYFTTRYYEMGADRLLRTQCICNYMEEAAGNHAKLLGAGIEMLNSHGLAWILAKMRLILRRRPEAEQQVCLETWPVKVERLQFRRDFILYDEQRDVLATSVTQWVVMGVESRRLERFPDYVAAMEPENPVFAQESGDIRIPAVGEGSVIGPSFPIRLADIDLNMHVNNGRYVDFVLQAADEAGMGGELRQLDLMFRAEGKREDTVASRWLFEPDHPGHLLVSLVREADGQELARARACFTADQINFTGTVLES